MERNRRIAKAYARKHTISINGSCDDYQDGTTLGLNAFENPDRDSKTSYIKQHIGDGVRIKIHQNGDILVKRLARSNVFVHQTRSEGALGFKKSQSSGDVCALNASGGGADTAGEFYGVVAPRLGGLAAAAAAARSAAKRPPAASSASSSSGTSSGGVGAAAAAAGAGVQLQAQRVCRIFSMAKFKRALEFEARRALPNRARLQSMCISILSFVANDDNKLNLPAWVMVVNIVALDLLASEIGLVEPYDSVGPPAACASGPRAPVADENDHDGAALERPNGLRATARLSSRLPRAPAPLLGDARAGLGYGARPEFLSSDNFYDLEEAMPSGRGGGGGRGASAAAADAPGEPARHAANSDGELQAGPTRAAAQLGSSSSSGFNSQHSSYQHGAGFSSSSSGSSANSSSSSLSAGAPAAASAGVATSTADGTAAASAQKKTKHSSRLRQMLFMQSSRAATKRDKSAERRRRQQQPDAATAAARAESAPGRGKRPPKMPHGLAGAPSDVSQAASGAYTENNEPSDSFVMVSEPIAIPAPPTCAGGGPSGRANLILVSPTGLSPPTSKKLHAAARSVVAAESAQADAMATARLPSGIPAHAQLAPPAARRHILRYLMSAGAEVTATATPPLPPSRRALNRPLPGLPPHAGPERSRTDECLYYSGLQARVPHHPHLGPRAHPHPHHLWAAAAAAAVAAPPPPPPLLRGQQQAAALMLARHKQRQEQQQHAPAYITKSAISAILSDIKQNAQFKQQLRQQLAASGQFRAAPARSAAAAAAAESPAELASERANSQERGTPTRPPKFMRSLESLNRQATLEVGGGSGRQKSLSSLFTHVGGFLKRSARANK